MEMVNPKFRTLEELEQLDASLFPPFKDSLEILKRELCGKRDDGGPGSGNWGHAGRPGKKGGSSGGGGAHNRMGSSEEGYTSFSKEKKKMAKPHKLSHEELSKCPNGTVIAGMAGHYKKAKIEVWNNETFDYEFKEGFVSDDWGDFLEIDQVISAAGNDSYGLAIPDSANKNYLKPKGDPFSDERRTNAFKASEARDADDLLREKSGHIWRGLDDASKDALVGYTGETYFDINSGLRNGYNVSDSIRKDTELLTNAISQSVLDRDMYLFRGTSSSAAEKLFGLKSGDLATWSGQIEDLSTLVGTRGIDNGFLSCGTSEGKGFTSRDVQLKIYCPAGTQALYAEPFSAFGRGDQRSWDGISKQNSFSSENETILQRGCELRIVGAEWSGNKAILEVEVLSQMNNTIKSDGDDLDGFSKSSNPDNLEKHLDFYGQSATIKSQDNFDGGSGSGNHGHRGVKGQRGGSAAKSSHPKVTKFTTQNGRMKITSDLKVKASKSGKVSVTIKAGQEIEGIYSFAGKGSNANLVVSGTLSKQYGGKPKDWSHLCGYATVVNSNGSQERAEIHWFEHETVGQINFKVKKR